MSFQPLRRALSDPVPTFFASGTSPPLSMEEGAGCRDGGESELGAAAEELEGARCCEEEASPPAVPDTAAEGLGSTTTEGPRDDGDGSTEGERRYQYRSQYQDHHEYQQQQQSRYRYEPPRQHYPRPITFYTQVRFRDRAHRVAFFRTVVWEFISWVTVGYFVYAWLRNYERYFSGDLLENGNERVDGEGGGDGNEEVQLRLGDSREGALRRRRARSKGNKRGERRRRGFRALKAVLRRCFRAILAVWQGFWARIRQVCRVYGNGNEHRMGYAGQPTVQRVFLVPVPISIRSETLLPNETEGMEEVMLENGEEYVHEEDGRENEDGIPFPQPSAATTLRRRRAFLIPDSNDGESAAPVLGLGIAEPGPGRVRDGYAGSMMEAIIEEAFLS
ncbi:MAG: hypothetical protein Q9195_004102 [Heterodermia aff. obscurata]